MQKVSILCAARNSIYKQIQGLEVFDKDRCASTFDLSTPIVAHPPCRAWSAYCSHQAKPEPGEKELGPMCVAALKLCGGVLEHPAHSRLWDHCSLPEPGRSDGEFWCLQVNQSWWGDTRTKKTWLLVTYPLECLPPIPFRLHQPQGDRRRWQLMSKTQRAATSMEMALWLVEAARRAWVKV